MNNWLQVKLSAIVKTQKGKKPVDLGTFSEERNIPYIDIKAFEFNIIRQYCTDERIVLCDENNVLMVWDGSRSGLVGIGSKGAVGSTIAIISIPLMNPKFLYYFFQSHFTYLNTNARGVGIPHVDPIYFGNLELPITSNRQQASIVEKIEELFSHIDAGVEGLKQAKTKLQQYRQSVLKDAVTGELTKAWREEHADTLEPAGIFSENILAERKNCWEQKQIELYQIKGKLPKTEKWKDKYSIPKVMIEHTNMHSSHLLVTLNHLKFYSIYGPRFSSNDYSDDGVLVLRTTDIDEYGRVNRESAPKLALTDDEYKKYSVNKGDFLITRTGSIGTLAIYNDEYKAIPGAYLLHYKLVNKYVNSTYIYFVFKSPQYQALLRESTTGIGIQNINAPTLESLEFLLPSLEEQNKIVDAVNEKLRYIEKCENDINIALKKSSAQKSSVLAKAFSGELVENIDTEETAEQLLEKIQAEKQLLEEKAKLAKKKPNTRAKKMDKQPIITVLKKAKKALSVDELFEQAGFQNDVSPEGIEAFYQELKVVTENENVTVTPVMLKEKKLGDKFEYKEIEQNEAG